MKITAELERLWHYQDAEKIKREIGKLLNDSLPSRVEQELIRIKKMENHENMLPQIDELIAKIESNFEKKVYR